MASPVDLPAPQPRTARADVAVALVSMPFMTFYRPSIQLGLLKAIGEEHGVPVTTFPLYLDLAAELGPEPYQVFCDAGRNLLVGEWLFSVAAFGDAAPDHGRRLLDRYPEATATLLAELKRPQEYLLALREVEIPRFLDRITEEIDWGRFAVVGFSCTFEQTAASIALAARIKARFPHVVTLFGGANLDGEMGAELVRGVECIDYAVVGEGDVAFPEFLAAVHDGRDPAAVAGVVARRDGAVVDAGRAPLLRGLDALPFPDHDDWFARAERLGLADIDGFPVEIPFESARGCWWGQKHHCTFCGLNGTGMAFRSKSAGRVRDELDQAAKRYRTTRYAAVDNILDMAYLNDRPTTATRIAPRLGLDPAELAAALDELSADGLVMREGDAYLALALPCAEHTEGEPR